MSSGSVLNLVRCENTRRVLKAALDQGWVYVQYTKGGHIEIRWPETDTHLWTGTTPSDRNAWKNFARDIEKVSGITVVRQGNRRRSKQSVKPSGFSIETAQREQAETARVVAEQRAQERRKAEAQRVRAEYLEAQERRRWEIEALMQPGNGR